jgi:Mrp family chromosome partitioning ATPase
VSADDNPSKTMLVQRRELVATPQGDSPVRVVPAWASPPDTSVLVMLGDSAPQATAALRVIRHRLEQRRAEGMWTFGVTSPCDGDGKSTFSTQLALVLSESQRARVLLVEANFQRPTLARILGFKVPDGQGFSAQIVRKMRGSMEPWCVTALGPALHILAESTTEPVFPETLHSTHFQNAIGFLSRGYDFLVVDGPSILGSGDANVLENAIDGLILLCRSRSSRGNDLREAVKQVGDRKAVGVVLWDVDGKPDRASPRARAVT